MSLGKNIQQARKEKGYSLQELSDRCGVSRSMLSQIERGEKNPTVQVACQIAEGLEMTLSQLLGEQEEREVIVIRKQERLVFRDPETGFERQLLSPSFPARGVEFIRNLLPEGQSTGRFPRHKQGVCEHLTVVRGRLRAILGERVVELNEGDSLYFEADVAHRFDNIGSGTCEYYLVIDTPEK
ncbi:helix-turn-helix domain-containing protein [Brevibacillus sp. SYP-B805]|uniref:helix-turn-helix domain-containing protein n=1 Tax=Brevibacillus sp. SYP-B805 TaxID=1578199 RepID=UPI0013E9AFF9|nr:XRE family transcriptional regulator [Brevibacillus sp. SYP-B805]NGQ96270.1 helix-turn-helix domain-containing protein [Brevibacillus sp. SYP-B805]